MSYTTELFTVYRVAMQRCRWFLLAMTIFSGLMLVHLYVEQLSFDEDQLKEALLIGLDHQRLIDADTFPPRRKPQILDSLRKLGHKQYGRFFIDTLSVLDTLRTRILQYGSLRDNEWHRLRQEYASRYLAFLRTQHTLQGIGYTPGTLPFVGTQTPHNDYLPIMAIILTAFVVIVWLNYRVIECTVEELLKSEPVDDIKQHEMRTLIRLDFAFTGVLDTKDIFLAQSAQVVTFLLPFFALLLAVLLDMLPVMRFGMGGPHGTFPYHQIVARMIICGLSLLATLAFTIAIMRRVNRIDDRVKENGNTVL